MLIHRCTVGVSCVLSPRIELSLRTVRGMVSLNPPSYFLSSSDCERPRSPCCFLHLRSSYFARLFRLAILRYHVPILPAFTRASANVLPPHLRIQSLYTTLLADHLWTAVDFDVLAECSSDNFDAYANRLKSFGNPSTYPHL